MGVFWGLFNQNLSIQNILGNSEVLCWSAKWLGDDTVFFSSKQKASKRRMLTTIYKLLAAADAVVTYNGNSFDLKILNKEFALLGFGPPAPYKSIDLLAVMRKRFRFTSNKLGYVTEQLGLGEKTPHNGMQLWLDCMNPKSTDYASSWATMEKYNINDVILLEQLYEKVKGWIHNHPNLSLESEAICCPNCGSHDVQRRGYATTAVGKYARYVCKSCGKWSKQRTLKEPAEGAKLVGII